jgi:hypothetical protein
VTHSGIGEKAFVPKHSNSLPSSHPASNIAKINKGNIAYLAF